jgi:hypothetical protein
MFEFLVNGGILILSIPAAIIGLALWDGIGNIRDGRAYFNRKLF